MCLHARPITAVQTRASQGMSAWLSAATATGNKASRRQRSQKKKEAATSADVEGIESSNSEAEESARSADSTARRSLVDGRMWADVFAPKRVDELAVQPKKVQEIQAWLVQSLSRHTSNLYNGVPRKRLLILCGPPGTGKSTAVRVLAQSMSVRINEWHDNASAGRLAYHRHLRDEIYQPYVSAWDDFIDFVNRSVNYSSLPVCAVVERRSRKRRLPSEKPLSASQNEGKQTRGQLTLLESWPQNSTDSISDERLQRAFQLIVSPSNHDQNPVICVFSDVRESRIDMTQLAKLFSEDVIRSPFTSVIQVNAVTTAQMKKVLQRISDRALANISATTILSVSERSSGDIRHAINMMQMDVQQRRLQNRKRTRQKAPIMNRKDDLSNMLTAHQESQEEVSDDDVSRDPFLSDFHVVGKLLHGKNKLEKSNGKQWHVSDFDRIIDTAAIPVDRILSLVHANCPDYFTEIDDLEKAVGLMSLSQDWLSSSFRHAGTSEIAKRSQDCARAVLVRAIAVTNEHPAPSAFRPITGGRGYQATGRMLSRKEELFGIATSADPTPHIQDSVCRRDMYAFEVAPFVELRRPQHPVAVATSSTALSPADDDIEDDDTSEW
ncbi:hypothetical protein PINS_up003800 [Pythium insidiosum]|nr:hypothetical protein PINS_up003800 [Pythium insidiosum]